MHRATILVVEDNEDHVFLLKHAFQKAEVTNPLQVASTGEEAIAYLEGTEPYPDWNTFPLRLRRRRTHRAPRPIS